MRSPPTWVSLLRGQITAAGAPGRRTPARWSAAGVTDVVTLQRADEHADWLPDACAEVGMSWHHMPLSGRRLEGPSDRDTLAAIPTLLDLLRADPPRKLVVHCSAGLHRTGVCLYLLHRHAGLSPEATLASIAAARPLTAAELTRSTRRHGVLQDRAEALYQHQSQGQGHAPAGPP